MTFDPTKPVQTRDGWPAEIISRKRKGQHPIVALITCPERTEQAIYSYTIEGRFYSYDLNGLDLVNVPEKYVRWVNLMRWDSGLQFVTVHGSVQLAKDYLVPSGAHLIGCRCVEFEEGQFDE